MSLAFSGALKCTFVSAMPLPLARFQRRSPKVLRPLPTCAISSVSGPAAGNAVGTYVVSYGRNVGAVTAVRIARLPDSAGGLC